MELLLNGLALLITDGRAAAAPPLRRAISIFASADISVGDGLRWGWMAQAATKRPVGRRRLARDYRTAGPDRPQGRRA